MKRKVPKTQSRPRPAVAPVIDQSLVRATGPKTDEGKAASRMNAVRHGLNSGEVVLPQLGEAQADFDEHLHSALVAFKPQNAHEHELVVNIAETTWLLRRVRRYRQTITRHTFEGAVRRTNLEWDRGNFEATPEYFEARAQLPDESLLQRADAHRSRLIRQLKDLTSLLSATRRVTDVNVNILLAALILGKPPVSQNELRSDRRVDTATPDVIDAEYDTNV